jgi:hypothetical protein
MILSVAFAFLLSGTLALAQTYTVTNSCPTAIELFISGISQGNLATGASVVNTGRGGFYYTTTNGGFIDGRGVVGSRVGFYLDVSIASPRASHLQHVRPGALLVLLYRSGRQPKPSQHGNIGHPQQPLSGV